MTEKRFTDVEVDKYYGLICMNHNGQFHSYSEQSLEDLLNELAEENEELKQELAIYRKLMSCSNCKYHNYDWYDDGDEFEVCDKGNDVTNGICKDWEEIE